MKELRDIIYSIPLVKVVGSTAIQVMAICSDSRNITPNTLFIAINGALFDGNQFIDQAIEKGAIAVMCESLPITMAENICYLQVENVSKSLGVLAANFYDHPSSKLKLIGVTGTNGKTTIATLLFRLFCKLGYQTGLLSTVQNQINDKVFPTINTTPDPITLNSLLHEMVLTGCDYCFMEVSSHAIAQYRIEGLKFSGGIFTNLSHEHLDFHKTFDTYLKVKKSFFDNLDKAAFALSNIDDRNGMVMLQNTRARKKTYGLKNMANFKAKILESHFKGLLLNIDHQEVWFKLVGSFNAYNLLAVYSTAVLLNQDKNKVLTLLSDLDGAEGRFDYVTSSTGVIGIVDFAHTPDAVQNVLNTIHGLRKGIEQIITIIGCGGDRDKTKRPVMAQIACDWSDKVILTSDNPRNEKPEQIIQEMITGVLPPNNKKVLSIINRKEAIHAACHLAKAGDIILLAGKGHEKYQEIAGIKHPFNDKQILTECLNHMN